MTVSRTAAVARIEPEAEDQAVLVLEHDAALEAAYTRPGQYCRLALAAPERASYFALIDPPGAGPLRFLLRAGGAAADGLLAAPAGTEVEVRGPLGQGFPVERVHGRDVILVSAGSGLAAIRPVLLHLLPYAARRVWLYHGSRTRAHVPFARDLDQALGLGARVAIAISRESSSEGLGGRVQDAIARDRPDLSNAVAFVSGMGELIDALRTLLPALGLPPDEIHLNF